MLIPASEKVMRSLQLPKANILIIDDSEAVPLGRIQQLKKFYDLDLIATASHRLKEKFVRRH